MVMHLPSKLSARIHFFNGSPVKINELQFRIAIFSEVLLCMELWVFNILLAASTSRFKFLQI